MPDQVPAVGSLADIYPPAAVAAEQARWRDLVVDFQKAYRQPPSFIARSPGRVNVIGEHIDYSLYSVLPMAITADAILAVSSQPLTPEAPVPRIRLANRQPDSFPACEFEIPADGHVDIDATRLQWSNYFKSGLRGALQALRKKRGSTFVPCHMDVLVDGNVPVGGGLSSSAALVSASALAALAANQEPNIDKRELTELAIISERAVGVNSGGMDQAASVFAEQGSALFVSFSPSLTARPIKFPPTSPELTFVVAQSFVTSNKQVTGPINYNLRVVEVSLAAAYLNAVLNPPGSRLQPDASPLSLSLRGFQAQYILSHPASPSDRELKSYLGEERELKQMLALAETSLVQENGYSREEISQVLQVPVAELEKRFMSEFPVRAERFKLRQRAIHVFSEALRVISFLKLLEQPRSSPTGSDSTAFNQALGSLMNATQDSCRDLYECSCRELDQICSIARRAGAYGSRLTGAGWGGCSVHLVPADKVANVKEALEEEYYSKMELTRGQREKAVVVSRPAGGSALYRITDGADTR